MVQAPEYVPAVLDPVHVGTELILGYVRSLKVLLVTGEVNGTTIALVVVLVAKVLGDEMVGRFASAVTLLDI